MDDRYRDERKKLKRALRRMAMLRVQYEYRLEQLDRMDADQEMDELPKEDAPMTGFLVDLSGKLNHFGQAAISFMTGSADTDAVPDIEDRKRSRTSSASGHSGSSDILLSPSTVSSGSSRAPSHVSVYDEDEEDNIPLAKRYVKDYKKRMPKRAKDFT